MGRGLAFSSGAPCGLSRTSAEHLVTKEALSLENGQVVIHPIASAHTGPELDENGEPKADSMVEEYFDSSNRKISREEFDSLIAVPDGCETIGFGWTNLSDGISMEVLRESFEEFNDDVKVSSQDAAENGKIMNRI